MSTPAMNASTAQGAWKVLIVDDDPDVHSITRMALRGFEFHQRTLDFVSVYSGVDARKAITENPDAAVMLLDVVMETPRAGLDIVKYTREEAANDQVRIVLRTGQPGEAPEQRVVRDYDINDYREKTELTVPKLNTLMYSTLRAFRDIVNLKQQREALREAQAQAAAASRAKSSFLANISHEFRTPLNGIIGLAQMMGDEIYGPLGHAKYKEYCWDIRNSGENLLAKIESILEIAEQSLPTSAPQPESFDLVALVGECLRLSQDQGGGNEITPAGSEVKQIFLRADRRMVRHMLMNLLSNALKYNAAQGDVRVTARRLASGELVVSVVDRGPGIPQDVLARLGEPFTVEGEAYLWSRRGVGLGLAITKRLIEAHGGRLEIDSTQDQGTTARLVFPASCVETQPS